MGNLHLVTGRKGEAHISPADHGSLNAAIFGEGSYVMNRGSKFATTTVSNNEIQVADGDILMQGRHIRLDEGTFVSLAIENGAQGTYRNDLIVVRYTKDSVTGVEDSDLVVIKGTAVASDPVDPEYITGDIINDHVLTAEMPLYRVPLNGLNVQTLVPLFTEANVIPDGAVTTAKIGSKAVTSAKLGDSAVTTAKIYSSAVTEAKIANGAVTADKIGSGAVGTAKIADSAVTTAKLGSKAVTEAKLGDGAVTAAKLGSSAVTTAKVADKAITTAKLADNAVTPEKLNRVYCSIGERSVISSGEDLNNYTTVGSYGSRSYTITNTLLNCPVTGVVFNLDVKHSYGGATAVRPSSGAYYITQILSLTSGVEYRRGGSQTGTSITWSEWKKTLTTDDLYSPMSATGTLTEYAITADDLGKTLAPSSGASSLDIVYTLSADVANALPYGGEIAILRRYGASLKIKFASGIYSAIVGDTATVSGRTYSIPESFGMVVLKKINYSDTSTSWLVTGNVEVVS